MQLRSLLISIELLIVMVPLATSAEDVVDIRSRRELFVDHFLIDKLVGARLELQCPRPAEVAIRYDLPWEDHHAFYTTVLKDKDNFRMYYRGRGGKSGTTCYAESRDGIHWTRPVLDIVSFKGSTLNNVILPVALQFCPFIDTRPGVAASERYKANSRDSKPPSSLIGYVSADGVHWRKIREKPIVPVSLKGHFDSQNVMFWSEIEKLYVLYARHSEGGRRATSRSTSADFLNWTTQMPMTYSDTNTTTPSAHLYTNQTQPYFRAPHLYVSLPGRIFFADTKSVPRQDDRTEAIRRRRAVSSDVLDFYRKNTKSDGGGVGDVSDGVLLTSRAGSTRFDFTFKESFIRPGIGLNNWTTRNNYPACGVVQTGPYEMSFYVQRNYSQKSAHLQRMTLRLDGFASVSAPYSGGEMLTHPLTFSGRTLEINYSTSAAGSIRVEIQDQSGKPIPGFSLDDSSMIVGDHIEYIVAWKKGSDVSRLQGRPIRLRFVMKDADLFSMRFRDDSKLARLSWKRFHFWQPIAVF